VHVNAIPLTTREQPVGLTPAAFGQKMRWSLMMDGVLTLYQVEEEVGFGDAFNTSFSVRGHGGTGHGNLSLLDRLAHANPRQNADRAPQEGASFFAAMQSSLVGPGPSRASPEAQGRKATVNVTRTPSTERPNMRTLSRTASYNSQDSSVL
jgi:hypothetical protein